MAKKIIGSGLEMTHFPLKGRKKGSGLEMTHFLLILACC